VLNEVFVSNLPGFIDLPVYSQLSRSLQYARAAVCRSPACGRFLEFFFQISDYPFFLQFVFGNFVNILREPYFLNLYKFSIGILSSLIKSLLH